MIPAWNDAAQSFYRDLCDHWLMLRSIGSNAEFDPEGFPPGPVSSFTDAEIRAACRRKIERAFQRALWMHAERYAIRPPPKREPVITGLDTRWTDYVREHIEWMDPNDDR